MGNVLKIFAARNSKSNHEGYPAYERSLEEQYLQTLLTNTLGNTYYTDQSELLDEAMDMHQAMIEYDPEFMAKALITARHEGYMRLQPILGLTLLSQARPDLLDAVFPRVILIPSDLFDFLTILKSQGRGQGGRAIKRQINRFLCRTSEYWAIKYNGRGRGYNLTDVINTTHPKPETDQQQALFRYLLGKPTSLEALPQITAWEQLKRADTEAAIISCIAEGRLPFEVVTGVIQPTPSIWTALLEQMPTLALLRNLNALDRAGVLEENRSYIMERLTDREALRRTKILPFRFLNAFYQVKDALIQDSLRQAVELTFDNLPDLAGKTAIFLDISGSMNGEYLRTGSLFAVSLYKKTKGNGLFWLFDTRVDDARPSLHDSIITQASQIRARGGTDTGAPVRKLREDQIKVDNIIIITDEQQNSGSPFYRELKKYRQQLNPNTKAFVIDIAPYRHAMVPATDPITHYIYGWSEAVLSYISQETQGYGSMVEKVRSVDLAGQR
ncbi:TROVE domain-containing protein [Brevibacillus dissolubilis]|uniref:TROVE domain-containing protein n=1 Tax=Brevibacillus dissolubilis TaxID=1844116 RepID=UPI001117212F|nr:TROVE domain-containing protein [Brevibacillus dissolubilis]